MNCIFICIFNQEKYVEMAYLLLDSIFLYGCLDDKTNILIYTSTQFMNIIRQNSIFIENEDKIIFEINDTYNNIDKACKARLDLFNLSSINSVNLSSINSVNLSSTSELLPTSELAPLTYTKILYLDTDILVKGDINKIFSIIEEDILYTLEEGQLTDDDNWYGGKTLFGDEVNNYEDKSAFTSGILLFNNCENIKNLFSFIIEDIQNRPHTFGGYDQPYIVYNAFKNNCYNNKILKQYAVNNDQNAHSDKIIHHFPGGPGIYAHKIQYMNIFLDNIKNKNMVHNGASIYNAGKPPIKNTKFPLVAICVSYNYFDALQFTLPVNYLHFDKIYLITQEDDIQTIEFCKNFNNVCIFFYNFKNNGKKFDKFGALNFMQKIVYEECPESWYLIIDSDIVLPNNFIDILYKEKLNSKCIYGGIRNNLLKTSEFLDKRAIINDINNINFPNNNILHWKNQPPSILGCFQLYKKKCLYDITYDNAEGFGDYQFGHINFDIFCHLENIIYFHIGPGFVNWGGKVESFIDDINISIDDIYYIYKREFNNIYYDKQCNIYYNKNSLKYIVQIGGPFNRREALNEEFFNIIVSSNSQLVSSNTIHLNLEKFRILNKLIEDYNIYIIKYLYVDDCNILLDLNLFNIRPINIIFKNRDEVQISTILKHFNLYGYDIEEQTETDIHIKLFKSVNNEDDINTCSEQMRYDSYDFFKNKYNCSIAEIGAYKGYSTKILSKIFSKVYAVDNNVEWINFNKNLNKDSNNIKYIIFDIYANSSWDILPDNIQVAFIDADNSYYGAKSDILNSIERFTDLKYIILGNYGLSADVRQIVDELIQNKILKIEKFIGTNGLNNNAIGTNGLNNNEGIICSVIKRTIEKHTINCIFSVGADSNSGNFLTTFNLRKLKSPLDFIYVDFETAMRLISEQFENYLSDIVLFNKNAKRVELFYVKGTNKINDKFYSLLKNDNIHHMKTNHNKNNLLFNQNYLDGSNDENFANWESMCIFYNNDILNETIYNSMKGTIKTFNTTFHKYNETTCLFFITKLINNYHNYIDKLIHIKKKYNIHCFMIIIINCDNINDHYIYDEENKSLFIIKKIETKWHTINYTNEYNIILKYFNFSLIEKDKI